jgi:putative spermidine/putrescine transport system permease protein
MLSDRLFLLTCAYCILALPFMYQSIRNSLNAIPVMCYIESAEILGASRLLGFITVIVPNIMPGIATSFLLSVGVLFNDFAIINILAGSYLTTVQMFMQNNGWRSGHLTSAIIVSSFAITTLLTVVVIAIKERGQKDRQK